MKRIDLLDLPEETRDLIRECEAQGMRTAFERNGRPVAVLVSYDEYMALRETIEIANDALLYARIETAEEQGRSGRVVLMEDLPGSQSVETAAVWNDRLRIAESVQHDWQGLSADERSAVTAALRAIDDDPIVGAPLFEPLKGLWSHRSGNLRIVYRIVTEGRFIVILTIGRVS